MYRKNINLVVDGGIGVVGIGKNSMLRNECDMMMIMIATVYEFPPIYNRVLFTSSFFFDERKIPKKRRREKKEMGNAIGADFHVE